MLRADFLSAVAIAFVGLGPWNPAIAQQTCAVEFNEVGEHSFTVPNVDEIIVDAFGAQGGDWVGFPDADPPVLGSLGGRGAGVTGTVLAVSPGDQIDMVVGGRGQDLNVTGEPGDPGGTGGFNGGGDGGPANAHRGAGGGGATTVALNGTTMVIAGGGGGTAHVNEDGSAAGGDGGLNGEDGTGIPTQLDATPGLGATTTAGGAGGDGSSPGIGGFPGGDGTDGTAGQGGTGGDGPSHPDASGGSDGGGGGGGGLFGGGGGGGGNAGQGSGAAGGGGSSMGQPDSSTFQTGVKEGDGRVEIRYQCQADISIVKTASGPDPLEVGATVDYTFEVTNTGNVPLTDVTVTDPLEGLSAIDCPVDTLEPEESMTCTATYTVTQEDVEAGIIENTATTTGQPPPETNLPPPEDDDTATVPPTQDADIEIVKSGSGPDPLVLGATVDYTFEVTNTGNVTLTEVTVEDPLNGLSPIDCPDDTLAPGAEMTCTATYTVTQADVEAGVIENTATVAGTPPSGPPPTDESTATVPPTPPVPALPPLALVLLLALLATATLWTLRRARA